MDSEGLVRKLQACAGMLNTPKGLYVAHHARNFAEWIGNPGLFEECNKPYAFAQILELYDGGYIEPVQFRSDLHSPALPAVERHVSWMVHEIRQMERPKMFQWVGFATGAMAYYARGLAPRKDLFDVRDIPIAIQVARNEKLPYHHIAHLMLGYMQGWLWADGQGSVDDFQRMKGPDDRPVDATRTA